MFSMRRSRRLCPLTVNPLTPEEIYNIVKSHNVPAVYIQLKVLVDDGLIKMNIIFDSPTHITNSPDL